MRCVLDVLAERCGIASHFIDALQQRHDTPPEIKRSLLRALDLPADTDAQAEASLAELERREWLRALPPAVVAYADKGVQVPVVLPQGEGNVRWRLWLEDGSEQSGEAQTETLELIAEHELHGRQLEKRLLVLEQEAPWGYHRLWIEGQEAECHLIVTPGHCWLPDMCAGDNRFWGVAAQLYLLRSERNWGIGDFSDLRRLAEICKEHGCDAIGLNPLHAMFLDLPEHASPYSPLSRYLLNVLYIDVEAVPELQRSEAAKKLLASKDFQQKLATCRAADTVQYKEVAALKMSVLQPVFLQFEASGDAQRKEQFAAFISTADELLNIGCTFAALRQYFTDQNPDWHDCSQWPATYHHADSDEVRTFGKTHPELVRFHLWLQWVADQQLSAASDATKGMVIGLYRDLAVGGSPSGAEVWSNPDVMMGAAEVGAPPDEWNAAGQNWALPPFHPMRMREEGYRSFAALVRTNMRFAGGLRIDHVMALERLYLIPKGRSPRDGGYVHYPLEELVGVLALESHRNRCLVVGEDLGTVPKGFRERMEEANVLSYRLLLLEKEKKGYVAAKKYPRLALSTASSHDLPTLRGFWEGTDIDLKQKLGMFADDEALTKARRERDGDHEAMVKMFRDEGVLAAGDGLPGAVEFMEAAQAFLARTPSMLAMVQTDDIAEEPEQVNLPASMPDQYTSWSRRLSLPLEKFAEDERFLQLAAMMNKERGSGRREFP